MKGKEKEKGGKSNHAYIALFLLFVLVLIHVSLDHFSQSNPIQSNLSSMAVYKAFVEV